MRFRSALSVVAATSMMASCSGSSTGGSGSDAASSEATACGAVEYGLPTK